MKLEDVLTAKEAEQLWDLKDGTIRSSCTRGRLNEFIKYGQVRKSGSTWLITKEAMEQVYGKTKGEKEMEFLQLVESLKGSEITMVEMDNTLGEENSIFDYEEQDWFFGKDSAFVYTNEGIQYNVFFEVVEKHEDNTETIVLVKGAETIG